MSRSSVGLAVLGLAVAAVALSPPVDAAATRSLVDYMIQHLLLTMAAAPLLALAARHREGHGTALAIAAWAAFVGAIWVVHFSRLADMAASDGPLRYAIHAVFLVTAVGFWRCAIGRGRAADGSPVGRLGYLFSGMVAMDVVGVWLMSSTGLEYPAYGHGANALGVQHLAGAVMLAGSYPIALAGLVEVWRWVVREQHQAVAEEQVA